MTAHWLRSQQHYLMLVVNTAVTFSLISLLVGCDSGVLKKRKSLKTVKIGVQSDLMSFDPFSFQALGEKNITELLYDRFIYFENNRLKSDFKITIKLGPKSVTIGNLDPLLRKKIKDIFLKARSSVLWKDLFAPFKFEKISGSPDVYKITYYKDQNFISNLKSLVPLLVVDGGASGAYQVESFQKGMKLVLLKNPLKKNSITRIDQISLRKVKTISDGLGAVSQKDIDVFVPFFPSSKGDLEPYKNLKFSKSLEKIQKLRLFSKYGVKSPLHYFFCSNRKEISKVLEKDWELNPKSCARMKKAAPENLKIIMGSDYGKQILDILARIYLSKTGKRLDYEVLDSLKLSEKLKSGEFDHYLSIDVESETLPVLYDSFHSLGRYNSLRIQDKKLDMLLEKASKATTIKDFNFIEKQAKARLKQVLPYVFEYSRPQTEYVVQKNNNLILFKSSKTLMKFQK